MKNRITDLNDHLFSALERLGDEDLSGDDLAAECKRANAVVDVAGAVLDAGKLALRAAELKAEHGVSSGIELPPMLDAPALEPPE